MEITLLIARIMTLSCLCTLLWVSLQSNIISEKPKYILFFVGAASLALYFLFTILESILHPNAFSAITRNMQLIFANFSITLFSIGALILAVEMHKIQEKLRD